MGRCTVRRLCFWRKWRARDCWRKRQQKHGGGCGRGLVEVGWKEDGDGICNFSGVGSGDGSDCVGMASISFLTSFGICIFIRNLSNHTQG